MLKFRGGIIKTAGSMVIILFIGMIAASLAYCEEGPKDQKLNSMYGNVQSVDWVGAVLTVNDTQFIVPSNVQVVKGDDAIGFSDIKEGDTVTVKYYDQDDGPKAVKIIVEYGGDFPV